MQTIFFFSAKQAHVSHSTDAPVIAVKSFERGFYPIYTARSADELNKGRYSSEILESALAASMFGWATPAAREAAQFVEAAEKAPAAFSQRLR